MVNDHELPDQQGMTTEVAGVVTEQQDEVKASTPEREQSREKEVAIEQFVKKCEAIKGSYTA